jgi:apolipoprotein D and lipocalin family protein
MCSVTRIRRRLCAYGGIACAAALLGACRAPPPIATVEHVDLERFMGAWYVISAIPTWLERDAYNAVESYHLDADGSIATTFTFRRGSFDGDRIEYRPRGFVLDRQTNALWGMQFLWPIKAEYRIVYLAPDYSATVIGRSKRDYVWIMARTPELPVRTYDALVAVVTTAGYDEARLVKVPQRW